MKRFILIVFTLALFLCLASCGTKAAPAAEAAPQQTPAPIVEVPLTVQEVPSQPAAEPAAEQPKAEAPASAAPAPAVPAPAEPTEPAAQEVPPQPQPAAVNDEISASANGYTIEVLSAELSKDFNGSDIILIKYKFTNASSTSAAFWQATDQTVKQNGQKLSPEGIACDDPLFMNAYSQISGGQSIVCAYPYPMLSATDPLEVTVSIYNYNTATTSASASGKIYIG